MIHPRHRQLIDARVKVWCDALPNEALYAPMRYLMELPAKRIRPALVLMGAELFGGRPEEVLDEAIGIELFHNFTLMHDDIMDAAPLRRGMATVHVKWDANHAILSGDALMVKAYQLMARRAPVLDLFSRTALEVCEGQQADMDFERRDEVRIEEYNAMIRRKTAVLLSCALRTGAIAAGAATADVAHLGAFGEHLGLAFQVRDDLLDAFGESGTIGKQQGGDLRAGKKTWLLIRALERSVVEGSSVLLDELRKPVADRDAMRMRDVIEQLGVRTEAEAEVRLHDTAARAELDAITVDDDQKAPLRTLAAALLDRAH